MKPLVRICVVAALALLSFAPDARAAITLTLGQSSISNYFTGSVSVTVTGLTNGESVFLERFVDVNNSGTVDAGDLLVCRVVLTDGVAPSIGGVRNVNVPGDDDGTANGTIQAKVNFPDTTGFDHFVGNYLMRVTSTTRGLSDTKTFAITNTPFAQTVSGSVSGGANCAVALLASVAGDKQLVVGTYTDASGNYSLNAPVGSYTVVAAKSGTVFNFATAPNITLLASTTLNNVNTSLSGATRTITGKVADASTSGGLPAVLLRFESTDNMFTVAYTDTNGNFTASVAAGSYKLDMDEQAPLVQGYVLLNDNNPPVFDTTAGNVTGANVSLPKATALFYGFVRDALSNSYAGLGVRANDGGNIYGASAFSGTNGYFTLGVVGGTNWSLYLDNKQIAAMGLTSGSTNAFISPGQALQADVPVQAVTAHLTGRLVDNFNNPLPNFPLAVQISTGSMLMGNTQYPNTDGSGNFDIGVFGAGGGNSLTWNVALECVHANSSNLVSFSKDFVVFDNTNQNNITLVAQRATFVINGTARDTNNVGVSNIVFFANASINGTNYVVGCITNGADGSFQLNAINGNWTVGAQDQFGINVRGFVAPTNQNATVNNGNASVTFVIQRFTDVHPFASAPGLLGGNSFIANVTAAAGANYRIEFSTNFTAWTAIYTNFSNNGMFSLYDPNATNKFRFYRVSLVTNYYGSP